MEFTTADGIIFYCLPDYARCKCTGISPEAMIECPLHKFDIHGDKCIPDLCDEYTEDISDAS